MQKAWMLIVEFQVVNHSVTQQREEHLVNVDGAVFAQSRQSGIGVVIQDHEGRVITVLSNKIHQPLGLLEAKAKSMEVGVFFCMGCWYKRCSF